MQAKLSEKEYLQLARSIARETTCRQLEKFKSLAYGHCRTKYLNFSVSLKIELKKFNNSDFNNIPAKAEIITSTVISSSNEDSDFFRNP